MLTPDAFRERFALATYADGGIVVDLQAGGYTRLNASAAVYLRALQAAESIEAAADEVARALRLPIATAAKYLRDVMAALIQADRRQDPIGPFTYRSLGDDGCELWERDRLAIRVDGDGHLRLMAEPGSLSFRLFDHVSELAPKLLFSQGVTVLHGSSCQRQAGLLGMCGKSRAGKTTTARTFARYGAPLVTEDLLVFHTALDRPSVFAEAEAKVHRWSRETARALDEDARAAIDVRTLRAAATGPTIPFEALWFLDAERRGARFEVRPLSRTEALGRLITNGFLGGADAASWRRYLAALHAIVGAAAASEAYLPDGLERLDAAIAGYSTNSAS